MCVCMTEKVVENACVCVCVGIRALGVLGSGMISSQTDVCDGCVFVCICLCTGIHVCEHISACMYRMWTHVDLHVFLSTKKKAGAVWQHWHTENFKMSLSLEREQNVYCTKWFTFRILALNLMNFKVSTVWTVDASVIGNSPFLWCCILLFSAFLQWFTCGVQLQV